MDDRDREQSDGRDVPLDRRTLMKGVGVAGLAATGIGVGGGSATAEVPHADSRNTRKKRRSNAKDVRDFDSDKNLKNEHPINLHPFTDEESKYGRDVNYFANYSKGLPHDSNGEVDPDAYEALADALDTPRGGDFSAVPENGARNLVNPEGSVSYNESGLDSNDAWQPAAPAFESDETGAEMVELYWKALLRDVPFSEYDTNSLAQDAISELDSLAAYNGPTNSNGNVTAQQLFRGTIGGVDEGPYVSQFLLKDFTNGIRIQDQKQNNFQPGVDYLTDNDGNLGGSSNPFDNWLALQNGNLPFGGPFPPREGVRRHIATGRDLATFVRANNSQQQFINAFNILLGQGLPLDPNVPVQGGGAADGFIDYGRSEILGAIGGLVNKHLRAAWYHKWRVHRRPRPETYGGRIRQIVEGVTIDGQAASDRYPVPSNVLNSDALATHQQEFGTALLSQAYKVGSPTHPSFPAGHGATAGSLATIIKAMFDEDATVQNPKEVSLNDDGSSSLVDYTDGSLTVRQEANKLAANTHLGRNFGGIHYRTDGFTGELLGERIAVSVLSDLLANKEPGAYGTRGSFTFTNFDGVKVRVTASGVEAADGSTLTPFDPPLYG